jgi:hypothetical protein
LYQGCLGNFGDTGCAWKVGKQVNVAAIFLEDNDDRLDLVKRLRKRTVLGNRHRNADHRSSDS